MSRLRILIVRLLGLLRWRSAKDELEQEIQFHLEMQAEENARRGMGREEAWFAASRSFGGMQQMKEAFREQAGFAPLDALAQDVSYGWRQLRKNKGFTVVAVLTLALGIAANTTVFSLVNATLLGALPVREPGRLVNFIYAGGGNSMSYPDYLDFRDSKVFEGVCAYFPLVPVSLSAGGEPERIWGQIVTGNYFSVVGVQPIVGRAFLPEEDQVPGRNPVVVLSHGLWQRRFGADHNLIGKSVIMNGRGYAVVGIAPAGFHGTDRGIIPEFWAPLSMYAQIMPELANDNPMNSRNSGWLSITGRLGQGVTRERAFAAVNVIESRILADVKGDDRLGRGNKQEWIMKLETAGGLPALRGLVVDLMTALMVVVGLVLLIACANVANLLLARASARQKEIGIRLAIGASRGRLIRQLLTESLLLSILGAAGGFALAWASTGLISRLQLPLPFPIALDFTPDSRVFAFTVALSVLTAVLFGLAPALRSTRPDLISALKDERSTLAGLRRFGTRNLLVVAQVAISMVLLVSAGLFLRSLKSASSIDIGMRPDNVLIMAVDPRLHGYSAAKAQQFFEQLQQRVSALPGVLSMSFVDIVPMSIGGTHSGFNALGSKETQRVNSNVFRVGAGYFETIGTPLMRGRDFSAENRSGDLVAMINQTMAERLFPGQDPIGRRVRGDAKTYEIVGVARNAKAQTIGEEATPCIYTFFQQGLNREFEYTSMTGVAMLVKTAANPTTMIRPVREQVKELDPNMAVFNIETMQDHVKKALLLPRLCAALFGIFGAVGLTLAVVGLYGVMSYSVRRRTREIGIRMALGAHAGEVLRLVAKQGVTLAAVGLAIGLAIAMAVSRFVAGLLYGISPTDAATFIVVPLILLTVAFLSVLVPARRAARVDPTVALRYE